MMSTSWSRFIWCDAFIALAVCFVCDGQMKKCMNFCVFCYNIFLMVRDYAKNLPIELLDMFMKLQ